ncbi:MAG: NHL domain-containing protein, partial [Planctomycetota bacterium]
MTGWRWLCALLALGLLLPANGCGYMQAAGVAWFVSQDDDDDDDPIAGGGGGTPTSVNVTTPAGNQSNNVALSYLLIDAESNSAGITVEYRFNAGAWTPASESVGPPSEGLAGLATSPGGTAHTFVWNSFADVGGQNGTAELRVTAIGGNAATTANFTLLNRLIATAAGGATGTLNFPGAVAADSNGNLYIADSFNHQLQVLNVQAGAITVAGVTIPANSLGVIAGTGTAGFNGDNQSAAQAQLNFPSGVALDPNDHIFIADSLNHRVRRIDTTSGFITTVAGSGTAGKAGNNSLATSAQLDTPRGIAFDGATPPNLFISDSGNNVLRVVNSQSTAQTFPQTGGVSVAPNFMALFCGNANLFGGQGDGGAAGSCRLNEPWGIAFDSNGHLYIAANKNHAVRAINMGTATTSILGVSIAAGDIDTVAGSNGQQGFTGDGAAATSAKMRTPKGIALSANDDLYIADTGNDRIRVANAGVSNLVLNVTIGAGNIDTIAGGGATPGANDGDGAAATSARCSAPEGLWVDGSGNAIVADTGLSR